MWIDKITDLFANNPALADAALVVVVVIMMSATVMLWRLVTRVRRITVTSRQHTTVQIDLETEKVPLPALVIKAVDDSPDRRAS